MESPGVKFGRRFTLIVAIALFAVIKGINTLNRKPKDAAPAAPPVDQ